MQDTISIVIPVFNRELYIEECVRSLLEQSYPNIQVILIDDGSEDKSLDICNRLSLEDQRIKVVAMEHGGVSKARNLGLDEANGKYIFFLDSDDVVHPQTLENILQQIKKHNGNIALVKGENIKQKDWESKIVTECMSVKTFDDVRVYSNQEAIGKFFETNEFGRMGGFMIKAEYLGQTRFSTDLFLGEDVRFMYENLLKGSDVVVLNENCYYWRMHPNKVTRDISAEGFMSRIRCIDFLWRSEEKLGRPTNSQIKKREILTVFIKQLTLAPLFDKEGKIIREYMWNYRRELIPDLQKRERVRLVLALNVPHLYFLCRKLIFRYNKFRKTKKMDK